MNEYNKLQVNKKYSHNIFIKIIAIHYYLQALDYDKLKFFRHYLRCDILF